MKARRADTILDKLEQTVEIFAKDLLGLCAMVLDKAEKGGCDQLAP